MPSREAAAEAERTMGITLRAIVTPIRHFGPDKAKETALCAAETAGRFVTGFGLAGDETVGKPKDFAWSFDMAREAGLRLTCHAGEWGGPDSIRDALRDLRVERIGHGVRAIEDLALVDELAERGIVLECCPGSNIALGIYPGWRRHPIGELFRREGEGHGLDRRPALLPHHHGARIRPAGRGLRLGRGRVPDHCAHCP